MQNIPFTYQDIKPILIFISILVGLKLVRKIIKHVLPAIKMIGYKDTK